MAVKTKVPYRVREKTLKAWLEKKFPGTDKAGRPLFDYKSAHEGSNDWWEVTAPRKITNDEIEEMKKKDLKKRQEVFDYDDEEESSSK